MARPKSVKTVIKAAIKQFTYIAPFDATKYAFGKQLAFIDSPKRFNVAKCSRRAGKTTGLIMKHYRKLTLRPGCNTLYLGISRKSAKNIIWKEFKDFLDKQKIQYVANNTELKITLSNGSVFYLGGCSTEPEIEKWRGMKFDYVSLDEVQSMKPFIKRLIREVLVPTLMDYQGGLDLTGTPNPSCAGIFRDTWEGINDMAGYEQFEWTFFDNISLPAVVAKLKTHQEILEEELKRTNKTIEDPVIQREWFGRWVKDYDSTVYKYHPAVNDFNGVLDPSKDWKYVLGCDLGFDDADAIVILAFCEDEPYIYVIEEYKQTSQDISSLAAKIKYFMKKYENKIVSAVADTGGLGKKIVEELKNRHGIHLKAAQKSEKWGYIKLMNDDFRAGRIKLAPHCENIKHEWENLEKVSAVNQTDPDAGVEDPRFENHLADSALYAWREAYHFTYKAKPKEPDVGSKEYWDKKEEEMYEQVQEEMTNEKQWWEQ